MKSLYLFLLTLLPALSMGARGRYSGFWNLVEATEYNVNSGLTQKFVQGIVQDSDHLIWIATWNGLEKFDGYSFHNYKSYPSDSVRLSHNRIPGVFNGPDRGLWIETYDSHMYIFDKSAERFVDPFSLHPGIKSCDEFTSRFLLPDGIMWLAARDGSLWRLDGKSYRSRGSLRYFQATRPERGETVHDIVADGLGREWVLTSHGFWVLDDDSIKGLTVYRRATPVEGGMLLIGSDGSLTRYCGPDGADRRSASSRGEAGANRFRSIAPGMEFDPQVTPLTLRDGRKVLARPGGLTLYDPCDDSVHDISGTFGGRITTLYDNPAFTSSKEMWALTDRSEVLRVDLMTLTASQLSLPYTDTGNSFFMDFVYTDPYGRVWIYPRDGHLCHYNRTDACLERAQVYNGHTRVPAPDITTMTIDDRGNLWGCTEDGFVRFTFLSPTCTLANDRASECRGLYTDRRGYIWIASKDGRISIYDKDFVYQGNLSPAGKIVGDESVKFGASVYCIMEDSRHRLWLGSRSQGLFLAVPTDDSRGSFRITRFTHSANNPESISNDAIYTVFEDRRGRLWTGTYGGGLNLIDESRDGKISFLHAANRGLPTFPIQKCNKVRHISRSSDGVIILCTTGGLVTFDEYEDDVAAIRFHRNWNDISRNSTLSNNDIIYAYEDSRHDLYLAVHSGGLCRLTSPSLLSDSLTFTHINNRNGLPSDMIKSISEDSRGRLWLALENAICSYDAATGRITTFDRHDFHLPVQVGEAPIMIGPDDVATIPMGYSVMRLDLASLAKSTYTPAIVFTGATFHSGNNPAEAIDLHNRTLSLSPDQRNISVTFSALDYVDPGNITYSYRLRGLDDSWIDNGHSHIATFYSLPAGDYVLEVRSTNCEGNWNDSTATLPIHVEPTFFETVWAKIMYFIAFLLIVLALWGVVTYIMHLQRSVDIEHKLSALKMKLFTDISHELRTPLTLIVNPVDEVLADDSLSVDSRSNLTIVKSNADRMLRLINQFLDLRKINNSKMKIYLEKIDVAAFFTGISNDFTGLARQRGISFRCDIPAGPLLSYTDPDKLEKITFNLLSNAFKYTPAGRCVTLAVRVDETDGEHTAINLSVRDEGPGIAEWHRQSVFHRFETLGRKQRGFISTGIGLSLVKELVDLLHGRIDIHSTPGEGTTFEVTLPAGYSDFSLDSNVEFILKDNDGVTLTASPEPPADGEHTLLVVEDNPEMRLMLKRIISHDYNVITAEDGLDALDMIDRATPDIIVSDIMMPRLDGLQLLARIRADRERSHIPFILLTAKASVEEKIQGLEAGADDYLTKPFSASYLKTRIKSLLDRRSRLLERLMTGESISEAESPVTPGADSGASGGSATADGSASMPPLSPYDRRLVESLMEFIERESQRPDLAIDEMAAHMNLSRTVFNRKVKSLLGLTPVELLTSVRLRNARRLLSEGSMTAAEIAYHTGFSSPQYFNRVFKAHHGCSPARWHEDMTDGIQPREVDKTNATV